MLKKAEEREEKVELVEEAKPDEDGERSAEAVDLVLDDVTAIFFFFERL